MTQAVLSRAANGVLQALVERADGAPEQIELVELRSVEWRSLTFAGERHHISLRLLGLGCRDLAFRLVWRLEDAEFCIPGHIVADVVVANGPAYDFAGLSVALTIEALTIEE